MFSTHSHAERFAAGRFCVQRQCIYHPDAGLCPACIEPQQLQIQPYQQLHIHRAHCRSQTMAHLAGSRLHSVAAPCGASRRPVAVHATKTKKKIGFKWDGANLRWVRDDRYADQAGDMAVTLIQPKTGVAYQAWPVVHTTLMEEGLQTISCQEALEMSRKGWTLVDVRLAAEFEALHAEGAINVPMYRYVEGDGFWENAKRIAMAGFAMKATERNPNFIADATKVLKKNQKILLMCAVGGTLDTNVSYRRDKRLYADPERAFGRESRSLKAAYELLEAGWSTSNMRHVEGGFQQWRYQDKPCDSSAE